MGDRQVAAVCFWTSLGQHRVGSEGLVFLDLEGQQAKGEGFRRRGGKGSRDWRVCEQRW